MIGPYVGWFLIWILAVCVVRSTANGFLAVLVAISATIMAGTATFVWIQTGHVPTGMIVGLVGLVLGNFVPKRWIEAQ